MVLVKIGRKRRKTIKFEDDKFKFTNPYVIVLKQAI
jgi:hypothetical protein